MNQESLQNIIQIFMWCAAGFCAVSWIVHFAAVNYRSWKTGSAPVETARAVAYCKHPEMEPVLAGRGSTYVYHITFHTDSGKIAKLYMDYAQFYVISEGAWGELT